MQTIFGVFAFFYLFELFLVFERLFEHIQSGYFVICFSLFSVSLNQIIVNRTVKQSNYLVWNLLGID